MFLIGLGFVGTISKLVLIENDVTFHFISFIHCSFVFTVALKKKGLEERGHDKQLENTEKKE